MPNELKVHLEMQTSRLAEPSVQLFLIGIPIPITINGTNTIPPPIPNKLEIIPAKKAGSCRENHHH